MQHLLLLVLLLNLQTVSTAYAAQTQEPVECVICYQSLKQPAQPKGCTCTQKLCCVDCFSKATFKEEQPECPLCKQPCKFHFRSFELTPREQNIPPQNFYLLRDDQQTLGLSGPNRRWTIMIAPHTLTAFAVSPRNRDNFFSLPRRVMKRLLQVAQRNGRTTLEEFGKDNQFIREVVEDLRLHAPHNTEQIKLFIAELDKAPIQRPPLDEEIRALVHNCHQQ